METSRVQLKIQLLVLCLHLCVAALSFTPCDARRSMHIVGGGARHQRVRGSSTTKPTNKIDVSKRLGWEIGAQLDASNTVPYGVSSPFSLPPYDSLPPIPLPDYAPPYCVYPPFTPQPPSTTIPTFPPPPPATGGGGGGGSTPTPTPSFPLPPPSSSTPIQSPPPGPESGGGIIPSPPQFMPSPNGPNPPEIVPGPPAPESVPSPPILVPSPTIPVLTPPYNFEPSPPFNNGPPAPSIFVPSPPVFQPPVVFPPPAVPPPPRKAPFSALWCVAKPTVPDPIIQEAMNYACGSGADCDSILPSGSCYQPDTLFAHASYAFNSYWQRTKVAGGTCDFGGTAILVTVDPSYDGCHFVYY